MKLLTLLLALSLNAGCAIEQQRVNNMVPAQEWVWTHDVLYAQLDAGSITKPEINHKFIIVKNTCKIQYLQVPIPSPSCTQPPSRDCTGRTGMSLGICQGANAGRGPRCDYSSVNAAYDARNEIFESCLIVAGWTKILKDS